MCSATSLYNNADTISTLPSVIMVIMVMAVNLYHKNQRLLFPLSMHTMRYENFKWLRFGKAICDICVTSCKAYSIYTVISCAYWCMCTEQNKYGLFRTGWYIPPC